MEDTIEKIFADYDSKVIDVFQAMDRVEALFSKSGKRTSLQNWLEMNEWILQHDTAPMDASRVHLKPADILTEIAAAMDELSPTKNKGEDNE